MARPRTRDRFPPRQDAKRKRWLNENATVEEAEARFAGIRYGGSQKHKERPHRFRLSPSSGFPPPDATLCDRDAGFTSQDMCRIPALLDRARRARLIGNLIWSVDDNGWVYELQMTNAGQNEHHGYPLRANDPFVEKVFRLFVAWARDDGKDSDRRAAEACRDRYAIK